ncbi:MAG TPA: M23 family metallopeptidase [Longimicrobiaceae bacterium]|nr:M23 family metallopeptidase [Longimicrobiaceae bacterium]
MPIGRYPPLRALAVAAALIELGVLLGLVLYLGVSGRTLVFSVVPREELRPREAPPRLIVPVAGVRVEELKDTYGAARSGGRGHKGVDIPAPLGTPVLAAAAGVIVRRDSSALGGISLYQRDLDARTIYYYAHLQRYRSGLKVGDLVHQGEVIAYVGETGNVTPGSPHLHFAVYTVTDPNRWWRGRDLNPYALLRSEAAGARAR